MLPLTQAGRLLELTDAMEKVIETHGAAEVPYQTGLSLQIITSAVKESLGNPVSKRCGTCCDGLRHDEIQ